MIQRTSSTSEGAGTSGGSGPAPKIWRLGSALRKIQSKNKDKDWVCRWSPSLSLTFLSFSVV